MLSRKVVIVTGGAGALGRAVVADFRDAGASVAVADTGAAVAGMERAPNLFPLATNLVDESSVSEMVKAVVDRFGRVDALLCLAGGFFGNIPVAGTPPGRMREQLELNLLTAYTAIHAALPHMVAGGGGAIVCVGSRPAVRPVAGSVAYATAKLGVLKVVEAVAEEYRDQGVRANAILPSIIDTEANRHAMPKADFARWVKPEEIAAVLRFLVSDDAKVISGAAIPVYGRA